MTKLMEWLICGGTFFGVWIAVLTSSDLTEGSRFLILAFPVILLFLFGLYAAAVVLYRVFTFNDCEDAAKELQRQIEEAKAELRIEGVLSG